ncbi:MAG: Slp family lipoprotein [Gammaproteobacteria bacterium]|nr:Slp family lipoprotein [Gammaproteobacteria bacterium]
MVTIDKHFDLLFKFVTFGVLLVLNACASPVPELIKVPLASMPELKQAQESPQQYAAQKVRWGGVILKTENQPKSTRITLLALPLYEDGEPKTAAASEGRFVAVFSSFIEPHVYVKERRITVIGQLQGNDVIQIGGYPYPHPVVQVEAHYLWPIEAIDSTNYWPPYDPWYHPWYDPFYYPYYYPYPFPHRH